MNPETKNCVNCKQNFVIEPEDFAFYEKIVVPAPTFCPRCRLQRRLAWRNERTLYKRKCDLCKQDTLTTYAPEYAGLVYCQKCWWSDEWDQLASGRDYDFSRPFFEQYRELYLTTPMKATFGLYSSMVNSQFTNLVSYVKNCYLIFNSDYDEECMYGTEIESSKYCFDNTMVDTCEYCLGCVNCRKCYQTFYSTNCESCVGTWFSKNCNGCTNAFGCANLKNKQYHIFNEPYSKEDYEQKIKEFNTGSSNAIESIKKTCEEWHLKFPERFMQGRQNTNVSGDYIYNSKDVRNTYVAKEAQSCKYCMWLLVPPVKDCFDFTEYGDNASLSYEALTCGNGVSKARFSASCISNSRDTDYSQHCTGVANTFGCVALRKKEYCILNKQYSKDDYETLVPKIIEHMKSTGEWGQFFPMAMSPYPYNDTNAYEFFPLTKEEVQAKGLVWRDPDIKNYKVTLTCEQIPDLIRMVPDKITEEIIECEHKGACAHQCATAFRILPKELEFYRNNNLPLPKQCPNCRSFDRRSRRRGMEVYHRHCMKAGCANEFETSYAPDRPEIVYCEQCYQNELV